jgi:hypothetical protein
MKATAAGPPLSAAARTAAASRTMLAGAEANTAHLNSNSFVRLFSAAPANQPIASDVASSPPLPEADAQSYEKLVEESIKKLMSETNHSTNTPDNNEQLKPISNEDLEVRLQYFQVRVCLFGLVSFFILGRKEATCRGTKRLAVVRKTKFF